MNEEVRYVIRMEVFAAVDADDIDNGDDRDYLQEIEDILLRSDEADEVELGDDVYQQARFDLCSDCRHKFMRDPLGRTAAVEFGFSNN